MFEFSAAQEEAANTQTSRRSFFKQLGVTLAAGLGLTQLIPRPAGAQPQRQDPEPDPSICVEPGEFYSDPNNCACYFACDAEQVPHHQCCPCGLAWNENPDCDERIPNNPACEPACDYLHNTSCGDRPLISLERRDDGSLVPCRDPIPDTSPRVPPQGGSSIPGPVG